MTLVCASHVSAPGDLLSIHLGPPSTTDGETSRLASVLPTSILVYGFWKHTILQVHCTHSP